MTIQIDNFNDVCREIVASHGKKIFKAKEIWDYAKENNHNAEQLYDFVKPCRVSHGKYDLSRFNDDSSIPMTVELVKNVNSDLIVVGSNNSYKPEKNPLYVKSEFHDTILKIISSGHFFPVMISGPTGNGKTLSCEQVCAETGRAMVRVNCTSETDEDSLMGGFRLINGETQFVDGPVITAMMNGDILLMDEIDLCSPQRLMCMQSIMEGIGYHNKRANRWVKPAPGFMVIATANTKGTGDETGKYVGTQILNAAALDRFAVHIETTYPTVQQEQLILRKKMKALNIPDNQIVSHLTAWAKAIRQAEKETPDIEHVISTRRLVNIIIGYDIFGDLDKSVNMSLKSLDEHHEKSFKTMFEALRPPKPAAQKRKDIPADWALNEEDPF